jgi:uncharacterized LabA/DUF88 family protein
LSKNVAVFVDVANLYYSARGQEVDVDYVALLKAATKGRDLIRAYAYSGLDPENENQRKFIDFLGKNGYKVVHKDIRKFGDGRVKANLDIELVVDLFRLRDRMDIAVIISGDGDFAPAIRALQDEGVRCEVISFRPNTSSDLIAVADEFIDIMKIASIGRGKDAEKADKVMSAPAMPAKEVVPEFGFREAPASVAAAALAALREGKDGKPAARGRGRGRTRTAAAAETADAAAAGEQASAPAVAAGDGDGAETGSAEVRRRRRRRGGRGRGRGRGRAEGVAAEAGATSESPETPAEIGWVELDDISQVGELIDEPREYTFEDADPETLAELGLLSETEAAGAVVADEVSETAGAPAERVSARASSSRPRRSRKPAADASQTAQATTPSRTRRGASKPAGARAAATETAATEAADTKPRTRRASKSAAPASDEKKAPTPRSRSRSKAPAEDSGASSEAPGDGEPEGIWQRFRSGREKNA